MSDLFLNLESYWQEEDQLRAWAKEQIYQSDYLPDHLELIICYLDSVALGGLFLRSFDQIIHAIRSEMSGNYTGCIMYVRDSLETNFLLSYLSIEPGRPEEWLRSGPDDANKNYRPVEIRKALDERDGFKMRKRAEHYKRLSVLGAHPTPQSFELKRDGMRLIHSGPLKHREYFEGCIQEIAIVSLLLSEQIIQLCSEVTEGDVVTSRLSLLLQRTKEKYFPEN